MYLMHIVHDDAFIRLVRCIQHTMNLQRTYAMIQLYKFICTISLLFIV